MSHASLRRRTKRLLKTLKRLQKDNAPVTPYILIEAKFRFLLSGRCSCVRVAYEELADGRFDIPHNPLPNFILSQLEAQKLTDAISPRDSILPVLFFIDSSRSTDPSRQASFPTLFCWYCRPRHRTYYFFAHLNLKMPSKSYTIDELLALRAEDSPVALRSLAKSSPVLATIIRDRRRGNSGPKQESYQRPPVTKSREGSSTSSDGIVLKGNARRSSATFPASASAITSAAVPVAVPAAVPAAISAAISAPVSAPVRLSACEMEWKYRGRSDSEATASEPVSAPTGLPAQKNEGFQRFYKAVVSPTHVRVTAGGRIVPNTRGPLSPTSKRVMSDATVDSHSAQEKLNSTKPIPGFLGVGQQPPPSVPQYFPAFPHGYPPVPTYLPMAFGPPMTGGFHIPTAVGGAMASQPPAEGTLQKTGDGQVDKVVEPSQSDKAKPSPPEQLDHSKPFVYNGQWMLPVPPHFQPPMGNQFMSGPMLGPHPMMGHPIPMPQQPAPPPNFGTPMMAPGAFPFALPTHPGFPGAMTASGPNNKAAEPPATPPISSIKPSDITSKQIVSFRSSLKYHEDQLQYNRHQIDEKFMENKVKAIREHIQHFEVLLKSQLEHEKIYYPKPEKVNEQQGRPKPSPVPIQKGADEAPRDSAATANHGRTETRSQHSGMDTATGKGGGVAFNFDPSGPAAQSTDRPKGLSIPCDAARAPAFLPRGEMVAQTDTNGSDMSWGMTECSKASDGNSGRRPLSANAGPWRIHSESSEMSSDNSSRAWESSATDARATAFPTAKAQLGVPYLVGTLPKGVDPRSAQDADYQYPRELTEDEIRSRHLYWGKAPRFVQQGLPKYDGKHFYPPSPVKEALPNGTSDLGLKVSKPEMDPFQHFDTVGEVNNKANAFGSDNTDPSVKHLRSFRSQIYSGSEELNKALEEVNGPPGSIHVHKVNSSDTGADSESVSSRDRCSDKSGGVKFWKKMARKGGTSSAVSSTTAQGYLPQYAGYAAKSLSPPINKTPLSPIRDGSQSKISDSPNLSDGGALLNPVPAKRDENRLPNGEGSLEEQFRHMVSIDATNRANLSSTFNL